MSLKLAILIPTLVERRIQRNILSLALLSQIQALGADDHVEILYAEDNRENTTGAKRNGLINFAIEKGAEYISFFDDDDHPGETYIKRGLEVVESGMDCGELWGDIYFNGIKGNPFHHYIDCVNPATGKIEWWQDENFYYRQINHLNFQKLSLVKDIPFPNQIFGEDGVQSERMRDAGIFKTMYPIPEIIYNYFVGEPKHAL